jgi:hypothetical protein
MNKLFYEYMTNQNLDFNTDHDLLGYVDKDTEKLYASWKRENGRAVVKDTIQNVDVYDGLYDI